MDTKAQARKGHVIGDLTAARQSILDATAILPAGEHDEVFLGTWSVKDLLAHLVGWDYTNLQATHEILAGHLPSFYRHHDRDWRSYNAHLVARHKREDFNDLLLDLRHSHRTLIESLQQVPADEFDRDRGLRVGRYKVEIARLLEAETRDELRRAEQVREFGKRRCEDTSAIGSPTDSV